MRLKTTILAAAAIAAPAMAATLPASADFSFPLPGITAAMDRSLAGPVVVDKIIPFRSDPGYGRVVSGQVQMRVIKSNADGNMHYYWCVKNDAGSSEYIRAFQVIGFPERPYEANWRMDGGGTVAPATVAGVHATIGGFQRRVIAFQFANGGLGGNQVSRCFFLKSSFPTIDRGTVRGRIKTTSMNIDIAISAPPGAAITPLP